MYIDLKELERLVREAQLAEMTRRYLMGETERYIDADYLRLIYGGAEAQKEG